MSAEGKASGAALILELHDIAPTTWPLYAPFLQQVEARHGALPWTLLVVPNWHRQVSLSSALALRDQLTARRAAGDELVLHGWVHSDEAPAPRSPGAWVRRRLLTREGEFAAIGRIEAQARLFRGLSMFAACGWLPGGFVAPGWQLGRQARQALEATALRWTADARHLIHLEDGATWFAPALVWSARSAWRRRVSHLVDSLRQRLYHDQPVLRLALHPVDMQYPAVRQHWLTLIGRLLQYRVPYTAGEWLEGQRLTQDVLV